MRKLTISFLVLLLIRLSLVAVNPSQLIASISGDCTGSGIQVNFADASWCNGSILNSGLGTSLDGVTNRVGTDYSDAVRNPLLVTVPAALQTRLDQVADRVGLDFADANRNPLLASPPSTMLTALDQVANRVGADFAQATRLKTLTYPTIIINDQTPPLLVGDITAAPLGNTAVRILWTTNEFADSAVQYGTQSGNYSQTLTDEAYKKDHMMELINLTADTTYYYRVSSTDQSGNTFTSSEQSFTLSSTTAVYLPLVVR